MTVPVICSEVGFAAVWSCDDIVPVELVDGEFWSWEDVVVLELVEPAVPAVL